MVWEDLIKTALIGTDRTKLSKDTQKKLAQFGIDLKAHPAKVLMDAFSFYANMQKLSQASTSWESPLPSACQKETKPSCSPLSIQHLSMILNSNYHGEILHEFLYFLRLHQMILPPEQIPQLLKRCKNNPNLWFLLKDVLGNKGNWLIQQNPDWRYLKQQLKEEDWETGTKAIRISFLKEQRAKDPQKAIALLKSNWIQEDFRVRLAFLKCLAINLSPSDEPFIETCLEDRKKEIRQEAANLLARISPSDFIDRISAKLQTIIQVKKRLLKKEKLELQLPALDDPFFKTHGIELGNSKYPGGQKAHLVGQLIALFPPKNWEVFLAQKPKNIIEIFARSEWSVLLLEASIDATILHQEEVWMKELVYFAIQQKNKSRWQELSFDRVFKVLPDTIFNEAAILLFQQQKMLVDEADILTKLLQNKVRPWEDRLSLLFIDSLKEWIIRSDNAWGGWHYKQVLAIAQYCIAPELFKQLTKDWPERARNWHNWVEPIERFLAILSFRAKMTQAFKTQ